MNYLLTLFSSKLFLLLAINLMQVNQKVVVKHTQLSAAITKISYSTNAGRGGTSVNLSITANELVYIQGQNGDEKTFKEKTSRSLWQNLTRSVNLQAFDKIKSDPGHGLYDGIDVTITVVKGKEEHSIVNGNEDTLNYKRIKGFTDILESQLSRLKTKIQW